MEYFALCAQKDQVLASLRESLQLAEENKSLETNAAISIQRVYRGGKKRDFFANKHRNATIVQRAFRGHCSRNRIKYMKAREAENRNILLFHSFALILQKSFRGYYSRKYRSSHFKRKEFIAKIATTAARIRDMQYEYSIQQALHDEFESKKQREDEVKYLAENLHHLISTKQIRGVFNPPPQYLSLPTMNEVPVEEHLRGTTRELLRTRGYKKTTASMVPDINGTLRIPLKTLKHKLSLQASAPYDALEKQRKSDNILHNVITTDREHKFFVSGGKTDIINPKFVPLSVGDTYIDPWNNPLLKRGVPESQRQLIESAMSRKALFAPTPPIPFIPRSGGNVSNVLPTTFDTIADAAQTGGVLKRHLGTTLRFGVPDNCDFRPPGSSIPTVPVRSSTLRQTKPNVRKHRITVQSIINSAKAQTGGSNSALLQLSIGKNRQEIDDELSFEDPLASSDEEGDI